MIGTCDFTNRADSEDSEGKVKSSRRSCKRVLVVTGPSGGHIFPALSFLRTLKERRPDVEVLLILPEQALHYSMVPGEWNVRYLFIPSIKLNLELKNIIAVLELLKGSFKSLGLLIEFRPDIVVGFGSINCVPLVMSAWFFRIKTLIHEQNVIPGRANRLLARFTDKIAVSFPQTKNRLNTGYKTVVTGNPIRPELKMNIKRAEALRFFGFSKDRLTMLVMGGSQGSHKINTCFLEAVSAMPQKAMFQVIHLAGPQDLPLLEQGYKNSGIDFRVFSFLKEMQYALSICDLAISRAGATTIAELAFFKSPAIIIPYPFAYEHQLGNAQALEKMGSAIVIKDNELEPEILRDFLIDLVNNPNKIKAMRSSYDEILKNDADRLLVDEALSLTSAT